MNEDKKVGDNRKAVLVSGVILIAFGTGYIMGSKYVLRQMQSTAETDLARTIALMRLSQNV